MQKIVFAINHRQTEDAITEHISSQFRVAGALTYREAVIDNIRETQADALLIRETLPGSVPIETLLKQIRVMFSNTRIIVICSERPNGDPFLKSLVDLGIYDIINSDKPRLPDIISYILTPRTFKDVAQYGVGLTSNPAPAQTAPQAQFPLTSPKKEGFIANFKKGIGILMSKSPASSPASAPPPAPVPDISKGPLIDVDLLRESVKVSEARKAQSELDAMVRDAVDKQTSALLKETDNLKESLAKAQAEVSIAESRAVSAMEQVNQIRAEKDELMISLMDSKAETQKIINLYESQLKALNDPINTPEWYKEQSAIWETERARLNSELSAASKERDTLKTKCELLESQAQINSSQIVSLSEELSRAKETQTAGADIDGTINQLRTELSEARSDAMRAEAENKKMQEELRALRYGGVDYSIPIFDVPLLPDDTVYNASESVQKILFLGSKHGVGATTIALNFAAGVAARGYKTLLMEINPHYPLLNQYFEFTHVPYGVNEAVTAVASGELGKVDKAIIRPHGLSPTQSNLIKTYKRLPAGLHFMLFSNKSLVEGNYEKNPLVSEASVFTLVNYLTRQQKYSYVILDVQCDDDRLLKCIYNSGLSIDKLCMVLTQDTHALASAGAQIIEMSRSHLPSLVANGEFIINRYHSSVPITQKKIETMLHINPNQISRISEDTPGFLSAAYNALPYVINKGAYWMAFDDLRTKICG